MSDEEKTYRSANARVIQDNAIISINLHWIRNIFVAGICLGGIIFKYEQRLRLAEESIRDIGKRVDELAAIHDAEMKEIEAWYKKSLEIDLNPLNILKRKNKQEQHMPKVGKRKFSYTKKGKQAAKKYAKKMGKKVMRRKKK